MTVETEFWTARALLAWQVELGADEAILDQPIDRFALPDEGPKAALAAPVAAPVAASVQSDGRPPKPDLPPAPPSVAEQTQIAVAAAHAAANGAASIAELEQALAGFGGCELKKGARSLVFADGTPGAQVMIIGEAATRDDDQEGKPFSGKPGVLLDRMLAAIGRDRRAEDPALGAYLTTLVPWRPPGDRAATAAEIAMLAPFVAAHIRLAAPRVVVLMGNGPCQALLGQQGVSRLRGQWVQLFDRPCLPMLDPIALMRTPDAKRDAWADLLALRSQLAKGADQ